MSDLKKYIEERKKKDKAFAEGYEEGYKKWYREGIHGFVYSQLYILKECSKGLESCLEKELNLLKSSIEEEAERIYDKEIRQWFLDCQWEGSLWHFSEAFPNILRNAFLLRLILCLKPN